MANLASGLCSPWAIDRTNMCWGVPDTVPETTITVMQQAASDFLFFRTGRRLGPSCPVVVRPCLKSCLDSYGLLGNRYLNQGQYLSTGGFIPYMAGGNMYNATVCGCETTCHCGPELCEITLPGPIFDITQIMIDGVVVDPLTYSVYGGNTVVRMNTPAVGDTPETSRCWPACQDMTLEGQLPNTFTITYRTGLRLSSLATLAVTQLTAHLIQGCAGGCGCGSSTRNNLSRLSRQGVDLEFVDPTTVLGEGLTGIQFVDLFINAENPHGLASPMRVLSPDAPRYPRIWNEYI